MGLGQETGYFKKLENEEQGIEIEMKNHLIGVEGLNENLPTAKNQEVSFFLFLLYLVCN